MLVYYNLNLFKEIQEKNVNFSQQFNKFVTECKYVLFSQGSVLFLAFRNVNKDQIYFPFALFLKFNQHKKRM